MISVFFCLSVSVFLCVSILPELHVIFSANFCACYPWPWLDSPLSALQCTSSFMRDLIFAHNWRICVLGDGHHRARVPLCRQKGTKPAMRHCLICLSFATYCLDGFQLRSL